MPRSPRSPPAPRRSAGGIASTIVSNRLPNDSDDVITLLPALSDSLAGRDLPPGILAQQVDWIGEHVFAQALGGILVALASLLMLFPLRYLFLAIQARNPKMGRAGIIATVTGCIASGVGFLVYTIAFSLDAKSFADEAVQTSGAARDAISGSAVQAATVIYQLGRFGLALALVIICLNAMRTGCSRGSSGCSGSCPACCSCCRSTSPASSGRSSSSRSGSCSSASGSGAGRPPGRPGPRSRGRPSRRCASGARRSRAGRIPRRTSSGRRSERPARRRAGEPTTTPRSGSRKRRRKGR